MKNNFKIDRKRIRLTLRYGADHERKVSYSGLWPRSSTAANINLQAVNLLFNGQKDKITGQITAQEETYLRSITMHFHLKCKDHKNNFISNLKDSPFLAINNNVTDKAFVIARKLPLRQNIQFTYSQRRHSVKIQWNFNCLVQPEKSLVLDKVTIRMGNQKDLLTRLVKDISLKNPLDMESRERIIWTVPLDSKGILRLKTLEDNLLILEENKLFYDQLRLTGLHPRAGDWLNIRKDFQSKIGFITRRIEHIGMTACLAFSPLSVSPESEVFRQHPDWCLRSLKGDPLPLLDITQKDVRDYLKTVMETFRNQWGFKSFHLTGLSDLTIPHLRKKSHYESGYLLSKTLQFFRENIGKVGSISAEGIPDLAGCGFIESLSTYKLEAQEQKAADLFYSVLERGVQKASLQKKLWINDPGLYPLGKSAETLPVQIRESIRQLILITGGILSIYTDHCELDAEGLKNLGEIFETFRTFCKGELIALSYAQRKHPAIIYNTSGHLGVFNLSKKTQSISLNLSLLQEKIGLSKSGTFIKEGQTGMKTGTLDLILPPYGSRVFRF
ncbi:MAG: hypothetical protein B6241_14060 [Spirochaetaceae bacterium 4572_59]|nr:MAG: hypothetical protein B6241_14060 [Spirochaetaceae bacterium 4572_59]